MAIKFTGDYRVKYDTPWLLKGDTMILGEDESYPEFLDEIYELPDGKKVCFNDQVWRIKEGVTPRVVGVQFNKVHLNNETELFGTQKAAEKALTTKLKERNNLQKEAWFNQDVYKAIENIALFATTKDKTVEKLFKDIEYIQKTAKEALNKLRG